MNTKILCCIFNYNDNLNAAGWADRLSPHFDTLILDSGSNPRCPHPLAVPLENVYYSGLMNEAFRRGKDGGYGWVMVVTSDLQISEADTPELVKAMKEVSSAVNVGLYQPSTAWKGRSLPQSRCHWSGRMRSTNFQEGWFHLIRIDLMEKVCPIDVTLNRLGWGVDLALSHFARIGGLLVLVDDRIRVVHPGGTGYNKKEALRQMRAWHASIPGYTSPRHFRPLKEPVKYLGDPFRLLVHLHVYYQDQVPWFLERLSNIGGCEWDLVVTGSGLAAETLERIRAFKADTRFIETENVGYDIWPFISALSQVNLESYDLVLKLHTKGENSGKYTVNGLHLGGYLWRNYLVDALLASPQQFLKCCQEFLLSASCGMVFERALLRRIKGLMAEEDKALKAEAERIGLNGSYSCFCAGTMFMASAKALIPLANLGLSADSFPSQSASHSAGSLAHVYERLIPFIVQSQGYRIHTVTAHPVQAAYVAATKAIEPILGWIFSLERVHPSNDKVLTLFGIKIIVSRGK